MSELNISLPSVRVAVTDVCNEHCSYCPTAGDSVEMQLDELDDTGFGQLVDTAIELGFSDYSITGGEPLVSDKTAQRTFMLARLINERRELAGRTGYTKLNTNGANLLRYQEDIRSTGFTELKVSLDSLNPETFQNLNGRGEKVLDATVAGILALKDHVPIRLQTVVGAYNVAEIPDMLQFCRSNGLDIKLFDISRYDNALAGSVQFWVDNYVPLAGITSDLQQQYGDPQIKYAVGGYGHPKRVFTTPEDTKIEVRDTSISAQYSSELCDGCPKYPCQDGLCNVVIAADGHIRFCREGGEEQTILTRDNAGQLLSAEVIRQQFVRAAGIFAAAQSLERPIRPVRHFLPLTVINK